MREDDRMFPQRATVSLMRAAWQGNRQAVAKLIIDHELDTGLNDDNRKFLSNIARGAR